MILPRKNISSPYFALCFKTTLLASSFLNTRYVVRGSRYLALGTWCLLLATWFLVLCSWYLLLPTPIYAQSLQCIESTVTLPDGTIKNLQKEQSAALPPGTGITYRDADGQNQSLVLPEPSTVAIPVQRLNDDDILEPNTEHQMIQSKDGKDLAQVWLTQEADGTGIRLYIKNLIADTCAPANLQPTTFFPSLISPAYAQDTCSVQQKVEIIRKVFGVEVAQRLDFGRVHVASLSEDFSEVTLRITESSRVPKKDITLFVQITKQPDDTYAINQFSEPLEQNRAWQIPTAAIPIVNALATLDGMTPTNWFRNLINPGTDSADIRLREPAADSSQFDTPADLVAAYQYSGTEQLKARLQQAVASNLKLPPSNDKPGLPAHLPTALLIETILNPKYAITLNDILSSGDARAQRELYDIIGISDYGNPDAAVEAGGSTLNGVPAGSPMAEYMEQVYLQLQTIYGTDQDLDAVLAYIAKVKDLARQYTQRINGREGDVTFFGPSSTDSPILRNFILATYLSSQQQDPSNPLLLVTGAHTGAGTGTNAAIKNQLLGSGLSPFDRYGREIPEREGNITNPLNVSGRNDKYLVKGIDLFEGDDLRNDDVLIAEHVEFLAQAAIDGADMAQIHANLPAKGQQVSLAMIRFLQALAELKYAQLNLNEHSFLALSPEARELHDKIVDIMIQKKSPSAISQKEAISLLKSAELLTSQGMIKPLVIDTHDLVQNGQFHFGFDVNGVAYASPAQWPYAPAFIDGSGSKRWGTPPFVPWTHINRDLWQHMLKQLTDHGQKIVLPEELAKSKLALGTFDAQTQQLFEVELTDGSNQPLADWLATQVQADIGDILRVQALLFNVARTMVYTGQIHPNALENLTTLLDTLTDNLDNFDINELNTVLQNQSSQYHQQATQALSSFKTNLNALISQDTAGDIRNIFASLNVRQQNANQENLNLSALVLNTDASYNDSQLKTFRHRMMDIYEAGDPKLEAFISWYSKVYPNSPIDADGILQAYSGKVVVSNPDQTRARYAHSIPQLTDKTFNSYVNATKVFTKWHLAEKMGQWEELSKDYEDFEQQQQEKINQELKDARSQLETCSLSSLPSSDTPTIAFGEPIVGNGYIRSLQDVDSVSDTFTYIGQKLDGIVGRLSDTRTPEIFLANSDSTCAIDGAMQNQSVVTTETGQPISVYKAQQPTIQTPSMDVYPVIMMAQGSAAESLLIDQADLADLHIVDVVYGLGFSDDGVSANPEAMAQIYQTIKQDPSIDQTKPYAVRVYVLEPNTPPADWRDQYQYALKDLPPVRDLVTITQKLNELKQNQHNNPTAPTVIKTIGLFHSYMGIMAHSYINSAASEHLVQIVYNFYDEIVLLAPALKSDHTFLLQRIGMRLRTNFEMIGKYERFLRPAVLPFVNIGYTLGSLLPDQFAHWFPRFVRNTGDIAVAQRNERAQFKMTMMSGAWILSEASKIEMPADLRRKLHVVIDPQDNQVNAAAVEENKDPNYTYHRLEDIGHNPFTQASKLVQALAPVLGFTTPHITTSVDKRAVGLQPTTNCNLGALPSSDTTPTIAFGEPIVGNGYIRSLQDVDSVSDTFTYIGQKMDGIVGGLGEGKELEVYTSESVGNACAFIKSPGKDDQTVTDERLATLNTSTIDEDAKFICPDNSSHPMKSVRLLLSQRRDNSWTIEVLCQELTKKSPILPVSVVDKKQNAGKIALGLLLGTAGVISPIMTADYYIGQHTDVPPHEVIADFIPILWQSITHPSPTGWWDTLNKKVEILLNQYAEEEKLSYEQIGIAREVAHSIEAGHYDYAWYLFREFFDHNPTPTLLNKELEEAVNNVSINSFQFDIDNSPMEVTFSDLMSNDEAKKLTTLMLANFLTFSGEAISLSLQEIAEKLNIDQNLLTSQYGYKPDPTPEKEALFSGMVQLIQHNDFPLIIDFDNYQEATVIAAGISPKDLENQLSSINSNNKNSNLFFFSIAPFVNKDAGFYGFYPSLESVTGKGINHAKVIFEKNLYVLTVDKNNHIKLHITDGSLDQQQEIFENEAGFVLTFGVDLENTHFDDIFNHEFINRGGGGIVNISKTPMFYGNLGSINPKLVTKIPAIVLKEDPKTGQEYTTTMLVDVNLLTNQEVYEGITVPLLRNLGVKHFTITDPFFRNFDIYKNTDEPVKNLIFPKISYGADIDAEYYAKPAVDPQIFIAVSPNSSP